MPRLSLASVALLSIFLNGVSGLPSFDLDSRSRTSDQNNLIIFDAPAFQNPSKPQETLVGLQSFAYTPAPNLSRQGTVLEMVLDVIGVDIGDKINSALDRLKLFGAKGLSGVTASVSLEGCSQIAITAATAGFPDAGMSLQNVTLGKCKTTGTTKVTAKVTKTKGLVSSPNVFFSPPGGFGVISDIDDTVKVSNVLDNIKFFESTLFGNAEPVEGMPELYTSLAKSLDSPQFIYLTGSLFQLYPFIHNFIETAFAASQGPILMRNLTLSIADIVQLVESDGIFEYKTSQIDRIHGMYPVKKFLTIGDSTQKDPETYGEAYRKYGDFVQCIWIRKVDGADNSDERFSAAFESVPSSKIRLYTDDEIPSLKNIDVANGKC